VFGTGASDAVVARKGEARTEMLDVTSNKTDDRTVVTVRGEIDAATCDELASALTAATRSQQGLEVDVSGVTFIDSSGLRTLVLAQQHLGDDRKLVVRGPDATFKRLLGITGLDEVFEIVD
jgi:anti-anti-sigma factor